MEKNEYTAKYNEYSQLLDATYSQAVAYLLNKYGAVTDDYYKEKSYTRFLNGEIKSISKGKYTRASEGLYCHHISEDKFQNLSDLRFISEFKYSYNVQKKENLVYCDLIEHLILHAIITKESNGQFGVAGLCQMIKPTVIDWYISEYTPKPALHLIKSKLQKNHLNQYFHFEYMYLKWKVLISKIVKPVS
ncbi:hypothetical protein O782_01721 [Staphylococcus aureus M0190]|nr:hypothetical protein O782_01721 [Staphylococcus aureus M0190]EUU32647.1 hypothetical protein O330_01573 [Staphylococcus aureus M0153]